jgi:hypothetical protein
MIAGNAGLMNVELSIVKNALTTSTATVERYCLGNFPLFLFQRALLAERELQAGSYCHLPAARVVCLYASEPDSHAKAEFLARLAAGCGCSISRS